MNEVEKEDLSFIMIEIMKAIKQVMSDGHGIILHFADAKITIEKEADQ